MKACSKCHETKPIECFYRDRRRGRNARCKQCKNQDLADWRVKNRDAHNETERRRYASSPKKWARHLRNRYGITPETYQALLERQAGRCAICSIAHGDGEETLCVDHDHLTGRVRGLLCAKCNRMLGCANDRPEVLLEGAKYLDSASIESLSEQQREVA